MNKILTSKPLLVMLYGYPGSGKSKFAKELSTLISAAHVDGDKIRSELFEEPRFDKQENNVVTHIMDYMSEEFLKAGMSVIYDTNALRLSQRRLLRELARKSHSSAILIWLQIDTETAFQRISKRDRRKNEDKFAVPYDRPAFDQYIKLMQNPSQEDFIVISGKHTFNTQRSAVIKKMYDLGLVDANTASSNVVKPGLVNLVPNAIGGRVDISRRNITIR